MSNIETQKVYNRVDSALLAVEELIIQGYRVQQRSVRLIGNYLQVSLIKEIASAETQAAVSEAITAQAEVAQAEVADAASEEVVTTKTVRKRTSRSKTLE